MDRWSSKHMMAGTLFAVGLSLGACTQLLGIEPLGEGDRAPDASTPRADARPSSDGPSLPDAAFRQPMLWVNSFGRNAGGWLVEHHPRMMADVDGDGRQDVVGFASAGVLVSLATGSSFTAPQLWVNEFGYDAGDWRVERHPRMMADVNGDGQQDVVGFASAGVVVSLSTGSSFTGSQPGVSGFGYDAGGWRVEHHPRMMADVNGDGQQDVVGFADAGVVVSVAIP